MDWKWLQGHQSVERLIWVDFSWGCYPGWQVTGPVSSGSTSLVPLRAPLKCSTASFGFLQKPFPTPVCLESRSSWGPLCSWERGVGLPEEAGKWMRRLSGIIAHRKGSVFLLRPRPFHFWIEKSACVVLELQVTWRREGVCREEQECFTSNSS